MRVGLWQRFVNGDFFLLRKDGGFRRQSFGISDKIEAVFCLERLPAPRMAFGVVLDAERHAAIIGGFFPHPGIAAGPHMMRVHF